MARHRWVKPAEGELKGSRWSLSSNTDRLLSNSFTVRFKHNHEMGGQAKGYMCLMGNNHVKNSFPPFQISRVTEGDPGSCGTTRDCVRWRNVFDSRRSDVWGNRTGCRAFISLTTERSGRRVVRFALGNLPTDDTSSNNAQYEDYGDNPNPTR